MARGHGGIVVVAPIGTKPLLGGSFSTVPAATRSGSLILFSSTRAGAERLNFSAITKSDSPGCTVYSRTDVNAVVVVASTAVVVVADDGDSSGPPETRAERTARDVNTAVLHNNHMWSLVRRNINLMLRVDTPESAPGCRRRTRLS